MIRAALRLLTFAAGVGLVAAAASSPPAVIVGPAPTDGVMQGVPVTVAPEVLFHTLAADFYPQRDGTIYVQTGDIPAMWLRDAAAQTLPYVRLARSRPMLRGWIAAVISREARNIAVDPYANAFRANYRVWERKWEVDSLAYPVLLAWAYENEFGDRRIFDVSLHRALRAVVATFDCERHHVRCSRYHRDRGAAPEIGMIWSAYRPSDDATQYAYNVPQQMQAATALRDLAELASVGYGDRDLAARALGIASDLDAAIARYGTFRDGRCGVVFAYEIDGRGRRTFADDANVPSLLAAPLLGYVASDDPTYRRTRACLLSGRNPYFFRGRDASGIGSPHTPHGFVWPLALIVRALTSSDRAEILEQMAELTQSSGPDGRIHESFDPNDPRRFTRAEFGWGNAMYAELLFRAAADFPVQPVSRAPSMPYRGYVEPSIAVVDPATALANRGLLIDAFERAVPLPVSTGGA